MNRSEFFVLGHAGAALQPQHCQFLFVSLALASSHCVQIEPWHQGDCVVREILSLPPQSPLPKAGERHFAILPLINRYLCLAFLKQSQYLSAWWCSSWIIPLTSQLMRIHRLINSSIYCRTQLSSIAQKSLIVVIYIKA